MSYQTGRVEVGGKDEDGEESMRFHVDFNNPFPEPPVVFLCPEGEEGADYADVFGVTVIEESVTEEGFDCNVGRMAKQENDGWGQNLQLNWMAMVSTSKLAQVQLVDVGAKDDEEAESVSVKVRFRCPFPRGCRPVVFATCYGQDYPDTFAVCVQKNSRKNVTLNICRGIGGGWGQDLKVAVFATTMLPYVKCDVGSGEGDRDVAMPDLNFPASFATRPTIFTIAWHENGSDYPDAFVCSPANVTREGFQLNCQRGNPEENGWGQNLRVQAILMP